MMNSGTAEPAAAGRATSAAGVTWDLATLYAGPDDARLEADLAEARRAADDFAGRYRGRAASLTPAELAVAIAEYEAIEERGRRPSFYASLLFGGASAIGPAVQTVGVTEGYYLFYAAPYALTLILLIYSSSPTQALAGAPQRTSQGVVAGLGAGLGDLLVLDVGAVQLGGRRVERQPDQ